MDSDAHTAATADDFKIRGAAKAKVKPQEPCTICLEPISERAVATPCNHLTFDFLCLVSWLQEQSTCPLCKAEVSEVQYDFRSPDNYKSYRVPKKEIAAPEARGGQWRRFPPRRINRPASQNTHPVVNDALERRRRIYRDQLFSAHVGANRISQYRDLTAQTFGTSLELQSRARMFLRRELQVFSFLDSNPRAGNRDFLIEYIVAILKTNELRGADGKAEDLITDFLGRENTRLVLHELEAWLRSPYTRMEDWDRNVQYAGERVQKR